MKKDSTKNNEIKFRFNVGDRVAVRKEFESEERVSHLVGKELLVKGCFIRSDGTRIYFVNDRESEFEDTMWQAEEVFLDPYTEVPKETDEEKKESVADTVDRNSSIWKGLEKRIRERINVRIEENQLTKYLRGMELSEDDYQILTDTWIGIERMKEILEGRVDGGTLLGHAVGSVHCIQSCIMEMLTSPKNTVYLNSFSKIGDRKKERKSEYRRKCPHCGKEFEYDSGNVIEEDRGLYGSFRFVECKKCGHELPHYESMIGNEIERIHEKHPEK